MATSSGGWPGLADPPADGGAAPPSPPPLSSFHAPGIGDDSWPAWSALFSLALPEPVTLASMEANRPGAGLFHGFDTLVLMGGGFGLDERAGSAALAPAGVLSFAPQAFGGGIEALVLVGLSGVAAVGVLFLPQAFAGATAGLAGLLSAAGVAFLFHGPGAVAGLAGLLSAVGVAFLFPAFAGAAAGLAGFLSAEVAFLPQAVEAGAAGLAGLLFAVEG